MTTRSSAEGYAPSVEGCLEILKRRGWSVVDPTLRWMLVKDRVGVDELAEVVAAGVRARHNGKTTAIRFRWVGPDPDGWGVATPGREAAGSPLASGDLIPGVYPLPVARPPRQGVVRFGAEVRREQRIKAAARVGEPLGGGEAGWDARLALPSGRATIGWASTLEGAKTRAAELAAEVEPASRWEWGAAWRAAKADPQTLRVQRPETWSPRGVQFAHPDAAEVTIRRVAPLAAAGWRWEYVRSRARLPSLVPGQYTSSEEALEVGRWEGAELGPLVPEVVAGVDVLRVESPEGIYLGDLIHQRVVERVVGGVPDDGGSDWFNPWYND